MKPLHCLPLVISFLLLSALSGCGTPCTAEARAAELAGDDATDCGLVSDGGASEALDCVKTAIRDERPFTISDEGWGKDSFYRRVFVQGSPGHAGAYLEDWFRCPASEPSEGCEPALTSWSCDAITLQDSDVTCENASVLATTCH